MWISLSASAAKPAPGINVEMANAAASKRRESLNIAKSPWGQASKQIAGGGQRQRRRYINELILRVNGKIDASEKLPDENRIAEKRRRAAWPCCHPTMIRDSARAVRYPECRWTAS